MLNLDKPVQTRAGQKARIICKDRGTKGNYKVVVLITGESGEEEEFLTYYTLHGKRQYVSPGDHFTDLVNAPEKITIWAMAAKHGSRWTISYNFLTEESVKAEIERFTGSYANVQCKAVKIEFEDD